MSKKEVLKHDPDVICKRQDNGRFYIFDDNTNPVFPNGHASSSKAWSDMLKLVISDAKTYKE